MTFRAAHIIAERQERDRLAVERLAMKSFSPISRAITGEILKAFQLGKSMEEVIRAAMLRMVPVIAHGMTAAHLKGWRRSELLAAVHLTTRPRAFATKTADLSVLEGALKFLTERADASSHDVNKLRRQYTRLAFAAIQPASAQAEKRLQHTIGRLVKEGLTIKDALPKLQRAMHKSGLTSAKPYVLEGIFRTQVQLAYSAGRQLRNSDPAIAEILWGYEYITVGDDRVRPTHAALEGTKLPKDDPKWDEIMPPNGFNCRCSVVEIFDKGTAKPPPESVEVDGKDVPVEPDPGFDFNPTELVTPDFMMPPQKFESPLDIETLAVARAKRMPTPPKSVDPITAARAISPRDAEIVAGIRRGDSIRLTSRLLGIDEATVNRVWLKWKDRLGPSQD